MPDCTDVLCLGRKIQGKIKIALCAHFGKGGISLLGEIIVCPGELDVDRILRASGLASESVEVTVCVTERQLMDKLINLKRRSPYFLLKTKEGKRVLRRDHILYVQAAGHRYCIYLADGETVLSNTKRCTFTQSMAPLLRDPRFLQCSASAVVNLDQVQEYRDGRLYLRGGTTLPFPARWRQQAQRTLFHLEWDGGEEG